MKKTMKQLLFSILMSCLAFFAHAQQRTVTGTVTDEQGAPLAGVSYVVKNSTSGGITDENGKFSINVTSNETELEFSMVGYQSKNILVGSLSSLNVVLSKGSGQLDEVVVTALGIKKENRNLGYAVSTVGGDEITRTNTINPITALQGKVAGLNINVMSASGVQSSPSILLRGAKSLDKNNQPIFVIDGMVIENNVYDADGVDAGSQMKNLNPDNYESITVLKGAAATAIYGTRGANGAIVITSKKGKAGTGLGISYTGTYQVGDIYKSGIALQDVYGQGAWSYREGNFDNTGNQILTSMSFGPKMDGRPINAQWDATKKTTYSPQPDNWKVFYQPGSYVNHNIALGGGSDKFTYRLSYSKLINNGSLKNNKIDRDNFDLRSTAQLNKVFSVDAGATYSVTNAKNFYGQGRYYWGGGQNLGFLTYYTVPRNADLTEWKNNYRNEDYSMRNYNYGQWNDVLNAAFNRIDNRDYNQKEMSLLTSLQLKAQVTDWLDVTAKANNNLYRVFNENKEYGSGKFHTGGYYELGGRYESRYNYLFAIHGSKKTMDDRLGIDVRLLNEYYGTQQKEEYGAHTDGGLQVPNVFALNNSVNTVVNTRKYIYSTPDNKATGLATIINLDWDNYLNLELTGRNDWLSTLTYPENVPGKNNYTVFYPSANLSYIFTEHFKNQMPSWLSFGKLRASLAYVGKGTDAYATSFGAYLPEAIKSPDGTSVTKAPLQNANILPNLDLKPERQRSWELGTNLGFLKDRINLDFTYYKTNTFNQILTIDNPIETGYNQRRINAGNIQNQGIEISLNATPVRNSDFKWEIGTNFTQNRGKIISFYPGIKEYALQSDYDGAGVYAFEGGDFGVITASYSNGSWLATDSKTGLPLLKVGDMVTGNGNNFRGYNWVTENFDNLEGKRKNTGKRVEPTFLAGINTTLRWKEFSFYTQIDSRFGGYTYSEAYQYGMGRGNLLNSLQFRDQEHGGVARTDSYTGQTVYNGAIPDAVFAEGQTSPLKAGTSIAGMTFREAYDKGLVEPWQAAHYNWSTYGWGMNLNAPKGALSEMSWIMLREISLGYSIPQRIVEKARLKNAALRFSVRNVGYLYNTLVGGQNPESVQSNDPFKPYITGAVPFMRNYGLTLNIAL